MGRGKAPVRRASTVLMAGVKVQMRNTVNKIQMNIKYVAIATTNYKLKINDITGMPLGGQCWTQTSGAASQRCSTCTECLPWTPEGGSWDGTSPLYCLNIKPLAHLESCNYTEKKQLCDKGLMCEEGVCARADKYKWDKMNSNQHRFG